MHWGVQSGAEDALGGAVMGLRMHWGVQSGAEDALGGAVRG